MNLEAVRIGSAVGRFSKGAKGAHGGEGSSYQAYSSSELGVLLQKNFILQRKQHEPAVGNRVQIVLSNLVFIQPDVSLGKSK